jgi:hypothetical protein
MVWIRIRVGSGFSNSHDPDTGSAKLSESGFEKLLHLQLYRYIYGWRVPGTCYSFDP